MKWTVAVVAVSLFAAFPSRAGDVCKSVCEMQSAACKKECAGDAECLGDCVESLKLCPKLCAASLKADGDPKKMQRAFEKVLREQEAEDARKEDADLEGHEHGHRNTKSDSSSY